MRAWQIVVLASAFAVAGCNATAPATTTAPSVPRATDKVPDTPAATATAAAPLLPGRIVFRRYSDSTETAGALFSVTSDRSGEKQLTRPPASTLDDEPDWSPNGAQILFTKSNFGADHQQLFIMSADGSGQKALTPAGSNGPNGLSEHDGFGAFSPDGTHIAFGSYRGREVNHQIQFSSIGVMNVNGSSRHQVTRSAAYSGDDGGVAWSPDGKHLLYGRSNAGATVPVDGRALFIVDIDGTHRRQLTPWALGAGGTPDWSAATNLIVFRAVASEEAGIGNFYTIRPDGTGLTQVTHFSNTVISHKVGFSADGKWIVFAKAGTDGTNDVSIARSDGSQVSGVTNNARADSSPDWAPR